MVGLLGTSVVHFLTNMFLKSEKGFPLFARLWYQPTTNQKGRTGVVIKKNTSVAIELRRSLETVTHPVRGVKEIISAPNQSLSVRKTTPAANERLVEAFART